MHRMTVFGIVLSVLVGILPAFCSADGDLGRKIDADAIRIGKQVQAAGVLVAKVDKLDVANASGGVKWTNEDDEALIATFIRLRGWRGKPLPISLTDALAYAAETESEDAKLGYAFLLWRARTRGNPRPSPDEQHALETVAPKMLADKSPKVRGAWLIALANCGPYLGQGASDALRESLGKAANDSVWEQIGVVMCLQSQPILDPEGKTILSMIGGRSPIVSGLATMVWWRRFCQWHGAEKNDLVLTAMETSARPWPLLFTFMGGRVRSNFASVPLTSDVALKKALTIAEKSPVKAFNAFPDKLGCTRATRKLFKREGGDEENKEVDLWTKMDGWGDRESAVLEVLAEVMYGCSGLRCGEEGSDRLFDF